MECGRETGSHLLAARRELRVAPDAALQVVAALAVATQVDGVGVDVDVHEVVHDLALDVVLHPVHQEAPAHIDHLDERAVPVESQHYDIVHTYLYTLESSSLE